MPGKGRVIALGFFDGVHIGHKALFDKVNDRAQQMDLIPSVMNFDVHPDKIVFNKPVGLLYNSEKRLEIIRKEFHIDDSILIHFDQKMMETSWDVFLTRLIEENELKWIVIGYDFTLGYKGLGTPEKISELCQIKGVGIDIIPPVELNGITVSSSQIRNYICGGDVIAANEMLGREFSINGKIIYGNHIGSKLGFPTINVMIPEGIILPSFGVYASKTSINNNSFDSITNIGIRPTFYSDSEITLETNIFNCTGDLYGLTAEIFFYKKIRDERKFADGADLSTQITKDIFEVKKFLNRKRN